MYVGENKYEYHTILIYLAFTYIVLYLIIAGMVYAERGGDLKKARARPKMLSLMPSDLFQSVGFLLFSWPQSIRLRVALSIERVVFVLYLIFFVLSLA